MFGVVINLAAVLQDVLLALELDERAKRVCDIGGAIAGLILFSPIFLITTLAMLVKGSVVLTKLNRDTWRRALQRLAIISGVTVTIVFGVIITFGVDGAVGPWIRGLDFLGDLVRPVTLLLPNPNS